MTSRSTRVAAAASAAVLGLALAAPVFASHAPLPPTAAGGALQQSTATPTPTVSATPGRPEGRGPENAPGRQSATPGAASATPNARGDHGKTPPTLPPNASERARTVVQAVFERNQQIRDLIAEMRAARGLPPIGGPEDVTDEFAKNAKQKRADDAVVDPKALTSEQREQFQMQLKAIMDAFAATLRQSASAATEGASAGTPTPTASPTATATQAS